jgi:hypothetical protein
MLRCWPGQQADPPAFFQLDNIRKARRRGQPWHLIVHEDVLDFSVPQAGGAAELAVSRPEPGRRSSLLAIAQPGQDRQQAA